MSLAFSSAAAADEASPFSYLLACERTFELAETILDEAMLVDSLSFSELVGVGDDDPVGS